jgi:hypothetical protein
MRAGSAARKAARNAQLLEMALRPVIEQLEARCLLSHDPVNVPDWAPLAPGPLRNGQVEGMAAQGNPVTGAVEAVAPHPKNPNILFIAATNGGIWRTQDALVQSPAWTALTDQYPSVSMGAIAIAPLDTAGAFLRADTPLNQTVIYAGTGRFSSSREVPPHGTPPSMLL